MYSIPLLLRFSMKMKSIGNKVDGNGLYGNYWSSSDVIIVGKSYNIASYLTFYSDGSHIAGSFCEYGLSVRLVKDL